MTSSLMAFCLSDAKLLLFFLDRFEGWADVQPMSYYCRVNSYHVRLLPCEDVLVLSQKLGEEAFEVFCYLGADISGMFRVVIQRHRL